MTLGEMIAVLEKLPSDAMVGLREPHSYRGYYERLAFEPCDPRPVAEVLSDARGCVGRTFTGYKGGDYTMDEGSDVHVAYEGACGDELTVSFFGTVNWEARAEKAEARVAELEAEKSALIGRGWGDDAYILGLEEKIARLEQRQALAEAIVANNKTVAEFVQELDEAIAARDAAQRREAAMREAVRSVRHHLPLQPLMRVDAALSADAGRDYIPRAVGQQLADACKLAERDLALCASEFEAEVHQSYEPVVGALAAWAEVTK